MNQYTLVNPEHANSKKNTKLRTRNRKIFICLGVAIAPVFFFIVHIFYVQHSTFRLLEGIGNQPINLYIAPKQYAIVSIFIANGFDNNLYLQSLCKLNVAINRFASIDKVLMILGKYNASDTCGWIPYSVKAVDGPKEKDPHANRSEMQSRTPWQDWSICGNGTVHTGAVKQAVRDFAEREQLKIWVSDDTWPSWLVQKPVKVVHTLPHIP